MKKIRLFENKYSKKYENINNKCSLIIIKKIHYFGGMNDLVARMMRKKRIANK